MVGDIEVPTIVATLLFPPWPTASRAVIPSSGFALRCHRTSMLNVQNVQNVQNLKEYKRNEIIIYKNIKTDILDILDIMDIYEVNREYATHIIFMHGLR